MSPAVSRAFLNFSGTESNYNQVVVSCGKGETTKGGEKGSAKNIRRSNDTGYSIVVIADLGIREAIFDVFGSVGRGCFAIAVINASLAETLVIGHGDQCQKT